MHRESDYAGLETVSTRKSEIKILTLTSCFCKGHLVVNWALVMQVMMCTHYREALQKCTALQQSSSSFCFTASKRVERSLLPRQHSSGCWQYFWTGDICSVPLQAYIWTSASRFPKLSVLLLQNLYFNRSQNTACSHQKNCKQKGKGLGFASRLVLPYMMLG